MSSNSQEAEVKRITWELASYKIELHKITGYLQCILQNATDLIFATDAEGHLVSLSKGGEKVLGYSWEEIVGQPIKDFAEDPVSFGRMMATSQEKGSAAALDIPFRHKDGGTVYCNASFMDLTNREGQTVGTVGICQDLTQWKRLQEDLVQVDRLAEIGRLAAGVAHEINNPVAVIREASAWAGEVIGDAKGLSSDDRQELEGVITDIKDQTERCRRITHKLLNFARDTAPAKSEFDVDELLKETVSFLKPEVKYTSINIDLNSMERPLLVNSDKKLLEQVFVNLITNAIHAIQATGKDAGHIEITTLKTNSDMEIRFKDDGVGIPAEEQAKIFTLFYTTKPPGKGTGLGLAICRNIVEKLGGDISVESEVGLGTTFAVRIPIS
jgi:PAS domain S-box-containing protein